MSHIGDGTHGPSTRFIGDKCKHFLGLLKGGARAEMSK